MPAQASSLQDIADETQALQRRRSNAIFAALRRMHPASQAAGVWLAMIATDAVLQQIFASTDYSSGMLISLPVAIRSLLDNGLNASDLYAVSSRIWEWVALITGICIWCNPFRFRKPAIFALSWFFVSETVTFLISLPHMGWNPPPAPDPYTHATTNSEIVEGLLPHLFKIIVAAVLARELAFRGNLAQQPAPPPAQQARPDFRRTNPGTLAAAVFLLTICGQNILQTKIYLPVDLVAMFRDFPPFYIYCALWDALAFFCALSAWICRPRFQRAVELVLVMEIALLAVRVKMWPHVAILRDLEPVWQLFLGTVVLITALSWRRSKYIPIPPKAPASAPAAANGPQTCHVCGAAATGKYCSECGASLGAPEVAATTSSVFKHLADGVKSKIVVALVIFKTAWLVAVKPRTLFLAWFNGTKALSQLDFPLSSLLRKLTKTPRGIIEPLAFLLVGVSIATAGGAAKDIQMYKLQGSSTQELNRRIDDYFPHVGHGGDDKPPPLPQWLSWPLSNALVKSLAKETILLLVFAFITAYSRIFISKKRLPRDKHWTVSAYLAGLQAMTLGIACYISPALGLFVYYSMGVLTGWVLPAVILPMVCPITIRRLFLAEIGAGMLGAIVIVLGKVALIIVLAIIQSTQPSSPYVIPLFLHPW